MFYFLLESTAIWDKKVIYSNIAIQQECKKIWRIFRLSLLYLCVQTLFRAHIDKKNSFFISKNDLTSVPYHLHIKLIF